MAYQAPCSFCDEKFLSPKALSEHLIICGNKTDPCPNCRRFIRRAIFAYHFENNCANLDEATGSVRPKSNSSDAKKTNASNMVKCEFCGADVLPEHYDLHKERCMARPRDSNNSNQNRSFTHQHRTDTDVVYLPCQFCDTPIESSNLLKHQDNCRPQQKALVPQNQHGNQNFAGQYQCRKCNTKFNQHQEFYIHENTCPKNHGPKSYAEAAGGRPQPSSNS